MLKDRTLYLAVTPDKYEFIIEIFQNSEELSRWSGRNIGSLRCSICRHQKDLRKNCKYVKVILDEENE